MESLPPSDTERRRNSIIIGKNMGILDTMGGWFRPKENNTIYNTPYGSFNLAKPADRARLKKVVVDIQRQSEALTRKDLQDWRNAWQMALNIENPSRARLYDIYRDVEIDAHLTGAITQRTGYVMARTFRIDAADGTKNEEAMKIFEAGWFKQFCRLALQKIYWGHSLIELGDAYTDEGGVRRYDSVKLIPRKHVIPEYGVVVREVGEDPKKGIDYRTPPISDWLVEVGEGDDLGLYLKAATQTIPKKNALGFWDNFAEIFGMPMRIAKTTTRDEKELDRVEGMMREMGAALYGVFQEGTEIEVIESSKSDAFNVYAQRIQNANTELSKLILTQTMTIEDGSSLSQSETHLDVLKNLIEDDCDMLRDVINGQLIPRMVKHGFPVQGLTFNWDYSVDYTPEQQLNIERLLLENFEVDGEYFVEKYGIPVGERRTNGFELPTPPEPDKKEKEQKHAAPFFD